MRMSSSLSISGPGGEAITVKFNFGVGTAGEINLVDMEVWRKLVCYLFWSRSLHQNFN